MSNFTLFYKEGDTVMFLRDMPCKVIAVFPHRIYVQEIGTNREYLCDDPTDIYIISRKN